MSDKSEKIYDGITNIDNELIEEARVPRASAADAKITDINAVRNSARNRRPRKWWMSAVAAVLVAVIALGVFLRPGGGGNITALAIAEPKYPEMAPFPTDYNAKDYSTRNKEWWDSVRKQQNYPVPDSLQTFSKSIVQEYLMNAGDQNRVVSPVNLYLALSMLAEVTDGGSRDQILSLLGASNIKTLRKDAENLWNASYRDDGTSASILANSVWLNDKINFNQKTMDTLADKYFASSYRGIMGGEEFNKALQDWINAQTGNLLQEQTENIKMDPSTVMSLVSAIYFRAAWDDEFNKNATDTGIFHAPGSDVTCDMMHGGADKYYWGEKFSAVSRRLAASMGNMYFILPDEGVSIDELLMDDETLQFLNHRIDWENSSFPLINLTLPKFDVVSDLDLIEGLVDLGITDVFDPSLSDFSPMTDDVENLYVSQAEHAARVAIDEEGVVAAAFTIIVMAEGAALVADQIDFVLDRPFLFVIAGPSDQTLFIGTVNQP